MYPQRFGQSVDNVLDPTLFERGNALSVDAVVDVIVVFLRIAKGAMFKRTL